MLRIRKAQVQALGDARMDGFHRDLLRHVRTHFPEETGNRGDAALLEHIRAAVRRASRHGVRAERDLHLYVNVSVVLGPEFDRSEEHAWTRSFLTDPFVTDPGQRVHLLHEELIRRLEAEEWSPRWIL